MKWEAGVNPARSRRCKWGLILHEATVKTGRRRVETIHKSEDQPEMSPRHGATVNLRGQKFMLRIKKIQSHCVLSTRLHSKVNFCLSLVSVF